MIESDLPIFFEQQLDPEATAMADFPSRGRDAFLAHWARIMKDDAVILKTILFENQVVGNIVSWEQSDQREIGYWLGKDFWGKGIATETLTEFLKIDKTRPLYAHVAIHNIASRRVLENCGFTLIKENAISEQAGELILKLKELGG